MSFDTICNIIRVSWCITKRTTLHIVFYGVYFMNIKTARLVMAPINEVSLTYIAKYLKDISLSVLIPKNVSKHHIKKFLSFNEKVKLFNSLGYFSIHLKQNFEIVGLIHIVPRYISQDLVNELGYLISEKYRNNNFAIEAIFSMVDFVFSKTNISRIYSLIDENNLVSKHILECKMKFDFVSMIIDSNAFKLVYKLDKTKFKCYKSFNDL